MTARDESPLVGIVGPCGAGKSTLARNLTAIGISNRAIAQEHSYVPDMWQRLTHPGVLIFLDASFRMTCLRRSLDWTEDNYNEQHFRLRHARQYADLYLYTDDLTPRQVLEAVLKYLDRRDDLSNGLDEHAAL